MKYEASSYNMSNIILQKPSNKHTESSPQEIRRVQDKYSPENEMDLSLKVLEKQIKAPESKLMHLKIFINSDVTVAAQVSTNKFQLFQIYRIGDHNHMFNNHYGVWQKDYGLRVNKLQLLTSGRMNLHKELLRASLVVTK